MLAKMAMIAMTTRSSIRVKPPWRFRERLGRGFALMGMTAVVSCRASQGKPFR
jgi:hypothetical protein